MICPAGFTADTLGIHEREPADITRTVYVCQEDLP